MTLTGIKPYRTLQVNENEGGMVAVTYTAWEVSKATYNLWRQALFANFPFCPWCKNEVKKRTFTQTFNHTPVTIHSIYCNSCGRRVYRVCTTRQVSYFDTGTL